jgi:hypothetical protein
MRTAALVPVLALGLLAACSDDATTSSPDPNPDSGTPPPSGTDGGGSADAKTTTDAGTKPPPTVDASSPPPTVDAGGSSSIQQHCVDKINQYRATLNLAPLARLNAKETCADGQSKTDALANKAHSAFGQCSEFAQNECPGWPTANMTQSLDGCLQMMWNEGPGQDFATHGHYINMSSTKYTKVFCGFYDLGNGKFWSVQDFQ